MIGSVKVIGMRKYLGLFLLIACFPNMGFANDENEHFYVKSMYGDVNVGYMAKADSRVRQFYLGGHMDLSLMNWKNDYKDQDGVKLGSDDFDFESVLGVDLFFGYKFTPTIHGDIELGYMGKYHEIETEHYVNFVTEKTEFDLEKYMFTVNAYYNFWKDFYAGVGVGVAMTNITINNSAVSEKSKRNFSPVGALMFGWSYELDRAVDFDIRYRLALSRGGDISVDTGGGSSIKTEIGYMLDNTLSAGIRYSF